MKKKLLLPIILFITLILLTLVGIKLYNVYKIKHAKIIVELKEDLKTEFLSNVKVSDFIESINGNIINDYEIDTKIVGLKDIKFDYINDDNIKVSYSYKLEIVDTTSPIIWLGSSYSVSVGSNINLLDKIMCGDNYDNNPSCTIIGDYDINTVGVYPLTFKATDKSGNETIKEFNLNVYKPTNKSNNNYSSTKTKVSDVIKEYKNDNTEIGIDISEWQGVVDFKKLKESGVEFVILRVGSTEGIKGDYFVDSKFVENIKKANEENIPVGIYYFSYANSKDKTLQDAKWVYEQIKDYKIDLGIFYDWENWSFYNEFNLSFFNLTDMANAFLDYFKDRGYDGYLYGSKNYLEEIWLDTSYPIWLAHYSKTTSYKGNYKYWQICDNGKVDGINGDVDINIRYLK